MSQPRKTNQSATTQSKPQEKSRFRNVRGLIAGLTGSVDFSPGTEGANVPEDVGLSGGTQVRECAIEVCLSREELVFKREGRSCLTIFCETPVGRRKKNGTVKA